MREDGTLYFLRGDNLGSRTLTTNALGNIISSIAYYPFDASRFSVGTYPTALDFIGQRADDTVRLRWRRQLGEEDRARWQGDRLHRRHLRS